MTADDLADLLGAALVKAHGGTRRRWRAVLGAVRLHDLATHPHCNWSVDPSGTAAETAATEALLDEVRLRYPVVSAG